MASSKWQGCVESKVMGSLEVVWKITSEFYEAKKWFPGMKSCERVEGGAEKGVGSERRCVVSFPSDEGSNDYFFVENLLAQDDVNHSFNLRWTDTDMPGFIGYEPTFEFSETGEHDNCLMKWLFQMNPIEGRSKEDVQAIRRSILTGMVKNLEQLASSQ